MDEYPLPWDLSNEQLIEKVLKLNNSATITKDDQKRIWFMGKALEYIHEWMCQIQKKMNATEEE